MKQSTINIIVIILLVIGLAIGIFALVIASKPPVVYPPGQNPPPPSGFGTVLGDIIAQVGGLVAGLFGNKCDPNRVDYEKDGTYNPQKCSYCAQNPNDAVCTGPDCYNGCKSSMPGYDCAGNLSSYC